MFTKQFYILIWKTPWAKSQSPYFTFSWPLLMQNTTDFGDYLDEYRHQDLAVYKSDKYRGNSWWRLWVCNLHWFQWALQVLRTSQDLANRQRSLLWLFVYDVWSFTVSLYAFERVNFNESSVFLSLVSIPYKQVLGTWVLGDKRGHPLQNQAPQFAVCACIWRASGVGGGHHLSFSSVCKAKHFT